MGFCGRLEAIRAPTKGKARKSKTYSASLTVPTLNQSPGDRPGRGRASSTPEATSMATERPASDHASHAARALVPPEPESCSIVPSVTIPLYRMTVSQTLRRALRGLSAHRLPKIASENVLAYAPSPWVSWHDRVPEDTLSLRHLF